MRRLLLLLSGLLAFPASLPAQEITVTGGASEPAAQLLSTIFGRGDYLLLDRDTVLAADTRIAGDLVVVGARVALEGHVEGAAAVVAGELFVRRTGSVDGPVALVAADAFFAGGRGDRQILEVPFSYDVEVTPIGGGYAIVLSEEAPPLPLRMPNLLGLGLPTYDRVNGLVLSWTVGLGDRARPANVEALATARYRTARRRADGALELRFRTRERWLLAARVASDARTNERWIRGDMANTAAALFTQSDARDYFHSDEASLTLSRTPPPSLVVGEGFFAPRLAARFSRDSSIETADVWSLFRGEDGWRANPAIDDGVIASLTAGAAGGRRGRTVQFAGSAAVEWSPGGYGDFDFAQLASAVGWRMRGLLDHRMQVDAVALVPLGDRPAPRQRWSFVGGSGTLPTLPTAHLRGDHVVFLNSFYLAPIPRLDLPLVGQPSVRIEYAVGAAWPTGEPRPPLEQNVGAGLQLTIFSAMLHFDPAIPSASPRFSVGAHLPGGAAVPPGF